MINSPIVCMVGLYKDCWTHMILVQITTVFRGYHTVYCRPTDTFNCQGE